MSSSYIYNRTKITSTPSRSSGETFWCKFKNILRTVPTIVIAHTFCASRDTPISYGWCLSIQGYFCPVQNYAEKAELCKCSWYPKRKLGVTMHVSEIIKLQFGKLNAIHCFVFQSFLQILLINYLRKMRGYPQFSFWISIRLVNICCSCIFSKPGKNTFELVGTVLTGKNVFNLTSY